MKRVNRIFLAVGFIALAVISWVVVLGAKSSSEKQAELVRKANEYLDEKIYIYAIPLLEEATLYNTNATIEIETKLKEIYLELSNQHKYRRKYTDMLEKQMAYRDAKPDIFMEAANFFLESSKYKDAITVLKDGIKKTADEELIALYESIRYEYKIGYTSYEDVTAYHGTTIGVKKDGLWGIARAGGKLQIPCEYERISTYSVDRAVALRDFEIFAIDADNNRIAKLSDDLEVSNFGNLSNDRIPLLFDDGWHFATGRFEIGNTSFDRIGTFLNGHAAAQYKGRWGVIDIGNAWLIPCEYSGIKMDELGRCYAQGAAFVVKGKSTYLFVDGCQIPEAYEDAKPFNQEGYAAVKKDGKWGYIDASGNLMIGYHFDDALSFGQHLAAVRVDTEPGGNDRSNEPSERWGYISLSGDIVIEPIFLKAKSFSGGSAPVLTERGWRFISLIE